MEEWTHLEGHDEVSEMKLSLQVQLDGDILHTCRAKRVKQIKNKNSLASFVTRQDFNFSFQQIGNFDRRRLWRSREIPCEAIVCLQFPAASQHLLLAAAPTVTQSSNRFPPLYSESECASESSENSYSGRKPALMLWHYTEDSWFSVFIFSGTVTGKDAQTAQLECVYTREGSGCMYPWTDVYFDWIVLTFWRILFHDLKQAHLFFILIILKFQQKHWTEAVDRDSYWIFRNILGIFSSQLYHLRKKRIV